MYYLTQCQWRQLHVTTLHRFQGGKYHVGKLPQHYSSFTLPAAKIPISFPRWWAPTASLFQPPLARLSYIHVQCMFPLHVRCKRHVNCLSTEATKDRVFWCKLRNRPALISCRGTILWTPKCYLLLWSAEENLAFPWLCKYVMLSKSCSIFLPSTIFCNLVTSTVSFTWRRQIKPEAWKNVKIKKFQSVLC